MPAQFARPLGPALRDVVDQPIVGIGRHKEFEKTFICRHAHTVTGGRPWANSAAWLFGLLDQKDADTYRGLHAGRRSEADGRIHSDAGRAGVDIRWRDRKSVV